MSNKLAAAFHGSGDCKRGCCWTPGYGCAKGWACDHHREYLENEIRESHEASKRANEWSAWR